MVLNGGATPAAKAPRQIANGPFTARPSLVRTASMSLSSSAARSSLARPVSAATRPTTGRFTAEPSLIRTASKNMLSSTALPSLARPENAATRPTTVTGPFTARPSLARTASMSLLPSAARPSFARPVSATTRSTMVVGHASAGPLSQSKKNWQAEAKASAARVQNLEAMLQMERQTKAEVQRRLDEYRAHIQELVALITETENSNRALHNELIDSKGKIRTMLRVRPPLAGQRDGCFLQVEGDATIAYQAGDRIGRFECERVFDKTKQQVDVFKAVQDLVVSVVHGYSVLLIAYGPTGSGKSYTMRGGSDDASKGLIPRALEKLIDEKQKLEAAGWQVAYIARYYELYNESIYDLLDGRAKKSFSFSDNNSWRQECFAVDVTSMESIDELLYVADQNRMVAATQANDISSRSHVNFEVEVQCIDTRTGQTLEAVLNIVDLAGSEQGIDNSKEELMQERANINESLLFLSNVLLLSRQSNAHINFRESKLTWMLKDALGRGSSKTLMLFTLSPEIEHAAEAARTIEFARNVSEISIGVAKRQDSRLHDAPDAA